MALDRLCPFAESLFLLGIGKREGKRRNKGKTNGREDVRKKSSYSFRKDEDEEEDAKKEV